MSDHGETGGEDGSSGAAAAATVPSPAVLQQPLATTRGRGLDSDERYGCLTGLPPPQEDRHERHGAAAWRRAARPPSTLGQPVAAPPRAAHGNAAACVRRAPQDRHRHGRD